MQCLVILVLFLKSAGTTLTKFPWADVVISDDVAYAWYKNRATTSIKDNLY